MLYKQHVYKNNNIVPLVMREASNKKKREKKTVYELASALHPFSGLYFSFSGIYIV